MTSHEHENPFDDSASSASDSEIGPSPQAHNRYSSIASNPVYWQSDSSLLFPHRRRAPPQSDFLPSQSSSLPRNSHSLEKPTSPEIDEPTEEDSTAEPVEIASDGTDNLDVIAKLQAGLTATHQKLKKSRHLNSLLKRDFSQAKVERDDLQRTQNERSRDDIRNNTAETRALQKENEILANKLHVVKVERRRGHEETIEYLEMQWESAMEDVKAKEQDCRGLREGLKAAQMERMRWKEEAEALQSVAREADPVIIKTRLGSALEISEGVKKENQRLIEELGLTTEALEGSRIDLEAKSRYAEDLEQRLEEVAETMGADRMTDGMKAEMREVQQKEVEMYNWVELIGGQVSALDQDLMRLQGLAMRGVGNLTGVKGRAILNQRQRAGERNLRVRKGVAEGRTSNRWSGAEVKAEPHDVRRLLKDVSPSRKILSISRIPSDAIWWTLLFGVIVIYTIRNTWAVRPPLWLWKATFSLENFIRVDRTPKCW